MKKEREELVPTDLLDVLLDADNTEPVAFIDEDGRQTYFRQVAVIPFMCGDEKRLYTLLAPLEAFDGVDTDSAIVFRVVSDGEGRSAISLEENEETAMAVYAQYNAALRAHGIEPHEEN